MDPILDLHPTLSVVTDEGRAWTSRALCRYRIVKSDSVLARALVV